MSSVRSIDTRVSDAALSRAPRERAATSFDHSLFVKNLSALWRCDPRLAQRIDEIPDEERLETCSARSGVVTAYVTSSRGRTYLHSRYDPVDEARRLIDGVPVNDKFCFLVSGLGLGYHVRELFDRVTGDACVVVSEPCLTTIATAMAVFDLSEVIASKRLVILTEVDKTIVHDRLKTFNTLMMLGAQLVVHPVSRQLAGAFHAEARRLVTDYVAYSRMTLLTLVGNSQATCRNIAYNLSTYLTTTPIDALRDRFRGCPAVIVSGGPSLHRNLYLLKEAKGHGIIITTQTLFKPLLDKGIVPDFVTSLDFHTMSQQFFHGIEDFHEVHLIAEPKVNWKVIDQYGGPVSLLYSDFAEQLIGKTLAGRDGLKAGASVAHLAYYLAEYLGCDPIVLVGQDLAFTGHVFYVPGVEVHRTWRNEINRFNTMETKEWERIVRNRSILRKTVDLHGREIYTDELLFTYREHFERDFESGRARVINATEGGAQIRGAEALSLRETLDTYFCHPISRELFAYRKNQGAVDTEAPVAAGQELRLRFNEIQCLAEVCDEMLGLLAELKGLTGDPDRFNQRLVRVDELRAVVRRSYRAYRIVSSVSQLAELQRYTADRKLRAVAAQGADRAIRQIGRDITYVQSLRDGCDVVATMLETTMQRLANGREVASP